MPCDDGTDVAISENVELTHFDDQSQNHSQNDENNCTNFCLYQCCGTPITIPSLYFYNEMKESVLLSYSFHYSSLYSFDYSNGIWHPPTLS
ncbi:MAG: hypothetical protein COC06_03270 [Bacteroidales bacterium]|nr:MAG: hypothetical protein COC06_03270 [Bacteroidales bacterium]